ncbi:hypothetical protein KIPB_000711 [Kipferlia bialata]|uniref:Uncharacterized protein n=1 Tax=Kipferlia bialata TaxID=797122 RepID=A0A9K3GER2_9EUKA|nr:hypothetical protein KIPB_000711 [Kipferlia bialata]|eukprot:g711.t1
MSPLSLTWALPYPICLREYPSECTALPPLSQRIPTPGGVLYTSGGKGETEGEMACAVLSLDETKLFIASLYHSGIVSPVALTLPCVLQCCTPYTRMPDSSLDAAPRRSLTGEHRLLHQWGFESLPGHGMVLVSCMGDTASEHIVLSRRKTPQPFSAFRAFELPYLSGRLTDRISDTSERVTEREGVRAIPAPVAVVSKAKALANRLKMHFHRHGVDITGLSLVVARPFPVPFVGPPQAPSQSDALMLLVPVSADMSLSVKPRVFTSPIASKCHDALKRQRKGEGETERPPSMADVRQRQRQRESMRSSRPSTPSRVVSGSSREARESRDGRERDKSGRETNRSLRRPPASGVNPMRGSGTRSVVRGAKANKAGKRGTPASRPVSRPAEEPLLMDDLSRAPKSRAQPAKKDTRRLVRASPGARSTGERERLVASPDGERERRLLAEIGMLDSRLEMSQMSRSQSRPPLDEMSYMATRDVGREAERERDESYMTPVEIGGVEAEGERERETLPDPAWSADTHAYQTQMVEEAELGLERERETQRVDERDLGLEAYPLESIGGESVDRRDAEAEAERDLQLDLPLEGEGEGEGEGEDVPLDRQSTQYRLDVARMRLRQRMEERDAARSKKDLDERARERERVEEFMDRERKLMEEEAERERQRAVSASKNHRREVYDSRIRALSHTQSLATSPSLSPQKAMRALSRSRSRRRTKTPVRRLTPHSPFEPRPRVSRPKPPKQVPLTVAHSVDTGPMPEEVEAEGERERQQEREVEEAQDVPSGSRSNSVRDISRAMRSSRMEERQRSRVTQTAKGTKRTSRPTSASQTSRASRASKTLGTSMGVRGLMRTLGSPLIRENDTSTFKQKRPRQKQDGEAEAEGERETITDSVSLLPPTPVLFAARASPVPRTDKSLSLPNKGVEGERLEGDTEEERGASPASLHGEGSLSASLDRSFVDRERERETEHRSDSYHSKRERDRVSRSVEREREREADRDTEADALLRDIDTSILRDMEGGRERQELVALAREGSLSLSRSVSRSRERERETSSLDGTLSPSVHVEYSDRRERERGSVHRSRSQRSPTPDSSRSERRSQRRSLSPDTSYASDSLSPIREREREREAEDVHSKRERERERRLQKEAEKEERERERRRAVAKREREWERERERELKAASERRRAEKAEEKNREREGSSSRRRSKSRRSSSSHKERQRERETERDRRGSVADKQTPPPLPPTLPPSLLHAYSKSPETRRPDAETTRRPDTETLKRPEAETEREREERSYSKRHREEVRSRSRSKSKRRSRSSKRMPTPPPPDMTLDEHSVPPPPPLPSFTQMERQREAEREGERPAAPHPNAQYTADVIKTSLSIDTDDTQEREREREAARERDQETREKRRRGPSDLQYVESLNVQSPGNTMFWD